ncbi:hypothetical protein CPB86DRAFT_534240 [Serendipita vermifera]|nr:hypothetical protein CPB86DRAFT_534240 [Serendipita vermifera]
MHWLGWLSCLVFHGIITSTHAQNVTTDTTSTSIPSLPLTFSMPPVVTQCTALNISWAGGTPWWVFSWQLSKGTIGDKSSLSEVISWQFSTDNPEPVELDFNPHQSEDEGVILFIMRDNGGDGQIAYACGYPDIGL